MDTGMGSRGMYSMAISIHSRYRLSTRASLLLRVLSQVLLLEYMGYSVALVTLILQVQQVPYRVQYTLQEGLCVVPYSQG